MACADGVIHTCEISPFDESSSLIAYGVGASGLPKLIVGQVQRTENGPDVATVHTLQQFTNSSQILCISWSPKSSASDISDDKGTRLVLCTGGADGKVRMLDVTLGQDEARYTECEGHDDCINAVAFDNFAGDNLVSTGDDETVRLWNATNGQQLACVPLQSPGVSVAWRPRKMGSTDDMLQYMVAERRGVVRFFKADPAGHTPLWSLTSTGPLTGADWNPCDTRVVGGASAGRLVCWNGESLPNPDMNAHVFSGNGKAQKFRWSRATSDTFAVVDTEKVELYTINDGCICKSVQYIKGHASSVSWHATEPICAVAMGSCLKILSANV